MSLLVTVGVRECGVDVFFIVLTFIPSFAKKQVHCFRAEIRIHIDSEISHKHPFSLSRNENTKLLFLQVLTTPELCLVPLMVETCSHWILSSPCVILRLS